MSFRKCSADRNSKQDLFNVLQPRQISYIEGVEKKVFFKSFNFSKFIAVGLSVVEWLFSLFGSSRPEVFLKISQNSQENTYARVSF